MDCDVSVFGVDRDSNHDCDFQLWIVSSANQRSVMGSLSPLVEKALNTPYNP